MGLLSLEQVLAEEAAELVGPGTKLSAEDLQPPLDTQESERARTHKNADARDGKDESPEEAERRKKFYRSLNQLNRSALCLSGGGIRSATFCLGVIQALAGYDVTTGTSGDNEKCPEASRNALLGRFQYLSTVSGGGYIGSWLSAWRSYNDFPKVVKGLTRRADPDVEPPEISWLRAYSNYLTPRVGVASADSWTAVAIYARNLLLNWLVIVPVLCLALFFLKFVAATSVWAARGQGDEWLIIAVGAIGALSLIIAQAFTTRHRPVRREPEPKLLLGQEPVASPNNIGQSAFVWHDLKWSVLSAIAVTLVLCSRPGVAWVKDRGPYTALIILAIVGALLFAVGWIAGWPVRRSLKDFALWMASGLVFGALVGLGACLFILLRPYMELPTERPSDFTLSLPIIFGIPWVLMSLLAAEMIFVGLVSYESDSDSDREWLGRAAGFVTAAGIGWAVTAFLSVGVGNLVMHGDDLWPHLGRYIASLGGVSGIATALIGKSGKTSATADDNDPSWTGFICNLLLSIAGPVFVAALIVGISIACDELMFGDTLLHALNDVPPSPATGTIVFLIVVGAVVAGVVGFVASKNVNINRFSLHAVYRNRLVRGYLGASRQARNPDRFTGFDAYDNVPVHTLWPPKATTDGGNIRGLFHVINISLNVVESKRLAWQERKAEPFTVSPKHCGSGFKGFRPSSEYAGPGGISLGTAMAISGAAVSPNMGYYSSPSISLLLALFNVRLGWWLGNPGRQGEESYNTEGPSFAITPLMEEALGLTTDNRPYVYLSDGGHFEDLGLYEMVRRRCRFIVVVDAGEDAHFQFADLGNAVRKIYIDLGVRIHFDGLPLLKNRPPDTVTDEQRRDIPYYAIGVIEYEAADGEQQGCGDGTILYIKPALHGTEAAGVISYAAAHPTFPHETTTDQWFTESQFESYRSLGLEITDRILRTNITLMGQSKVTLQELLAKLPETTRVAKSAGSPTCDGKLADAPP
jgi:Patatin-like phospholipase